MTGCKAWKGPLLQGEPVWDDRLARVVIWEQGAGPLKTWHRVRTTCQTPLCVAEGHLEAFVDSHPSSCKRGHIRTSENAYLQPNGATVCRPCRRDRDRTPERRKRRERS